MKNRFVTTFFAIALFLFPLPDNFAHADITTGLVGWWKFTDGSGSSAANSSGGAVGTLVGNPSWVTPGKIWSYALSFNGSSQYVNLNYSFPSGTSITYSAWEKSTSGGWYIVGDSFSNGVGFLGNDAGTNFATFRYRYGGGSELQLNGATTNILDGNWHLLTGAASSTGAVLYVDGKVENSSSTGASLTGGAIYAAAGPTPTPSLYFTGTLEDVRIYSRALSATDVTQLDAYGTAVHTKKFAHAYLTNVHSNY